MSGGSVQLIVVRARPEQSKHRAPHDTHDLLLQDPGVKLASEPGDSPEPEPEAVIVNDDARTKINHTVSRGGKAGADECGKQQEHGARDLMMQRVVKEEEEFDRSYCRMTYLPISIAMIFIHSFRLVRGPGPPPGPQLHLPLYRRIAQVHATVVARKRDRHPIDDVSLVLEMQV